MADDREVALCSDCGDPMLPRERVCDNCGTARDDVPELDHSPQQPSSERSVSRRSFGRIGVYATGVLLLGGGGVGAYLHWDTLREVPTRFIDSGHELLDEGEWDYFNTESEGTGDRIIGEFTLDAGQFTGHSVRAVSGSTVGIRLSEISGGTVDVWTLSESQLQKYADRESFAELDPLSATGIETSMELVDDVGSGEWFVVADNSDAFGSGADRSVSLRYEIAIGASLSDE